MRFAKCVDELKASDIREILKLTENPEVISFAGGVPDPQLFPIAEIMEVTTLILGESGQSALQYSSTEGHTPLREKIIQRMKTLGIEANLENILLTSGSQQGLDYSGKIFLNEGDAIICESPSYSGAIKAFMSYLPEFIEISTDNSGMNMDELERVLSKKKNVRLIYVIPDFQNPTGRTWSLEKRKRLIELANKYDIPIIEDDPYSDLRFEGEKLPPVKSFDTNGRVIYLGTFSKTFCPGLRIGWVVADNTVLQKYIFLKQGSDIHSNSLAQRQIDKFIDLYDFDKHIEKINTVYKKRKEVMVSSLKKHFPKNCTYTNPEGGLFIWVNLPEGLNARDILVAALKVNVAFIPGGSFFANLAQENTFRLNFSSMASEKIEVGIERLGLVLKASSYSL